MYSINYNTGNADAAMALGILGGLMVVYAIIVIVAYVLFVIGAWKIFTKAGEAGWKSIIPIYNTYIMFKISWQPSMFWVFLVLAVVSNVTRGIGTAMGGFLAIVPLLIALATALAMLVVSVMMNYKLACSFGYGVGFTLGLIFLPFIFTPILGFSSAEYEGPQV